MHLHKKMSAPNPYTDQKNILYNLVESMDVENVELKLTEKFINLSAKYAQKVNISKLCQDYLRTMKRADAKYEQTSHRIKNLALQKKVIESEIDALITSSVNEYLNNNEDEDKTISSTYSHIMDVTGNLFKDYKTDFVETSCTNLFNKWQKKNQESQDRIRLREDKDAKKKSDKEAKDNEKQEDSRRRKQAKEESAQMKRDEKEDENRSRRYDREDANSIKREQREEDARVKEEEAMIRKEEKENESRRKQEEKDEHNRSKISAKIEKDFKKVIHSVVREQMDDNRTLVQVMKIMLIREPQQCESYCTKLDNWINSEIKEVNDALQRKADDAQAKKNAKQRLKNAVSFIKNFWTKKENGDSTCEDCLKEVSTAHAEAVDDFSDAINKMINEEFENKGCREHEHGAALLASFLDATAGDIVSVQIKSKSRKSKDEPRILSEKQLAKVLKEFEADRTHMQTDDDVLLKHLENARNRANEEANTLFSHTALMEKFVKERRTRTDAKISVIEDRKSSKAANVRALALLSKFLDSKTWDDMENVKLKHLKTTDLELYVQKKIEKGLMTDADWIMYQPSITDEIVKMKDKAHEKKLTESIKKIIKESENLVYSQDYILSELLKKHKATIINTHKSYILSASSIAYVKKVNEFIDEAVKMYERSTDDVTVEKASDYIYELLQNHGDGLQGSIFAQYNKSINARLDEMVLNAAARIRTKETSMLDDDSDEMMDDVETEHGKIARMAMEEADMDDWNHDE